MFTTWFPRYLIWYRPFKTEQECLNYLTDINTTLLSEHESLSCEGKLTLKEIYQALESMPGKKSPGNDGLSKEFYLSFFDLLSQPLLESLNAAFDEGELSPSQRQAIITLIEKNGKDKRLIKNWRPISLLNIETKILSKVLATRIKSVIKSVIQPYQTAYVPGRYIGELVRLISDLFRSI